VVDLLDVRFVFRCCFDLAFDGIHCDTFAGRESSKCFESVFKSARPVVGTKYEAHGEQRRMSMEYDGLSGDTWDLAISTLLVMHN